MSYMLKPNIVILKDGTDESQGKGQIISNINACQSVVDVIKTTLGPRGMDKLIHSENRVTISNDGATLISLLDIVHPAAKTLVDIARSQDNEVGDGTTSVVLTAGELLKEAKTFIEEGMHSQIIIRGFRKAMTEAVKRIKEVSVKMNDMEADVKRDMLKKCAMTSLNSKLINTYKDFFADMVVDAVAHLEDDLDKRMIGIKKVTGGAVKDSFLVEGVAFKKTFSYAGFEQQQKQFTAPKICLLNLELELKSEKENAEIRIEDPSQYQAIVDAEWRIIYEKLENIVESGANVVLSKLPIGDLATQYFADRGLFCAGRVQIDDLKRVAASTGATVQTTVHGITPDVLGTCGDFEEKQIGAERYNIFTGCEHAKSVSLILRGGAEQFIEEAARSLNDAIMIVRRAMKAYAIVAGGGAIEMELSRHLRKYLKTIAGKEQLVINGFSKALEVIPRTLADNSGLDSTEIVNKLRQKHSTGEEDEGLWYGVDVLNERVADCYKQYIWEPQAVRINVLVAATEAACTILSVDETVKNPSSEQDQNEARRMAKLQDKMPNMGRGMQGRGGK
jgi:T-complex protein 1 subunit eta